MSEGTGLDLEVIYLLLHEVLILLELRAHALEALVIVLLVHVHLLVIIDFNLKLIPLFLDFFHSLMGQFKLVSQVIDVAFKCFDLSEVVLFLLLEFLDHELGATHVLLHIEAFLVQLVVVICELFDCFLVSFVFERCITIVLEDVLLFHFECADVLQGKPLLLLQLLVLFLQELIGLSCLCEFIIDKLVLSGKGLNIFCKLITILCFDLNDLGRLLDLVPLPLILLPKQLDLIFSFKQPPLEVVFLSSNDRDVMLHVAEFKNLLLHFLFGGR